MLIVCVPHTAQRFNFQYIPDIMAALDEGVAWAVLFHGIKKRLVKRRELTFVKMLMIDCVCISISLKNRWPNVKLHCVSFSNNWFNFNCLGAARVWWGTVFYDAIFFYDYKIFDFSIQNLLAFVYFSTNNNVFTFQIFKKIFIWLIYNMLKIYIFCNKSTNPHIRWAITT